MEGNALQYFWMTFVTWAGLAYLFFNNKICKDFHIKSKISASALTLSFSQHRDKRDVSEEVNEWCIYIAILWVLLYTQSAVQSWGEVSPQPPPVCSIHLDDATASHRTMAPVRSPHTSYRWRGERVIEPIKCMRSPHTSYRWRGERVIEPIKCMRSSHTSYRWRGERVIEPIKCMRSSHTSYRWRGERVIEPIKWMGIIRRPWMTRASGGNLARTPGLHPYSLREVPWPQRVRTSV